MILGLFLIVVGALLVLKNREVALYFGGEAHAHHWGFMSSVARQNIAVIGSIFFIGGAVFFFFF